MRVGKVQMVELHDIEVDTEKMLACPQYFYCFSFLQIELFLIDSSISELLEFC